MSTEHKYVSGTVLSALHTWFPLVLRVALWGRSYGEPHYKEGENTDLGKINNRPWDTQPVRYRAGIPVTIYLTLTHAFDHFDTNMFSLPE